ncbi:hypothetical protein ACFLSJ_05440, partial [Verrucomicrobiota bacterium]
MITARSHGRNSIMLTLAVFVVFALAGSGALAATELVESDDWAQEAEYAQAAAVAPGADGLVSVSFRSSSIPTPAYCGLIAGSSADVDAFAGSYDAAGVEGITFRMKAENGVAPGSVSILLSTSADPNMAAWVYDDVGVTAAAGEWATYAVPLERTAGWSKPGCFRPDGDWADDIANVQMLTVRISKGNFRSAET